MNENMQTQREDIKKIAETDYLTGLANRRGLHEYYAGLEKGTDLHILFIDIDNFKRVNDIYGHSMGDELLINISNLIRESANGYIFRIGGDEFVVMLDGSLGRDDVTDIAEQILYKFDNLEYRKDILAIVSLSIAIVLEQKSDLPMDEILYKCDAAMAQAKYDGKNRYSIYEAFDRVVEINKNIELEMEHALRSGEFKVYLQPKVNMVTSKIYGAEALSRWVHPIDGIRSPITYIPLFEKNGFISKLDMYMYEEICKLKASWKGRKYEHIPISVNMSRLHLFNKNFVKTIKEIADRYEIPAEELELEITENVFVKDSQELIRIVDLLESEGFKVSIDDFGSGYSALNLLKDLPVDTIKIDKEFLRVSSDDVKGKTVIRNIIAMCLDLKMEVVTEGIETLEQVEFIKSCGCQIAQGYYYSKPLPIEDFENFAEEHTIHTLDSYRFRFNDSLKSEDGSFEAVINGEGLCYEDGIFRDSKSIYFPGGEKELNTIFIPPNTIVNDSFTVSLWLKPTQLQLWMAALYIKFESGFCSIMPLAWEEEFVADMRIRDSRQVSGWYDVKGGEVKQDEWTHWVISYDAKKEVMASYLNGVKVGELDNVTANRYVKWIILGGDVFQPSFVGNICELVIYNEARSEEYVKELHRMYVESEDFIAF